MINIKKTVAVAASALAAAALSGGLMALPASAADSCPKWDDGTTFGVKCTDGSGKYRAMAKCTDGNWHYGNEVSAGSSSYVYCSRYGAKYVAGTGTLSVSPGPTN